MGEPSIEVVGVYRLEVTDELLREQLEILFSSDLPDDDRADAEEQVREQLQSTVLVEAFVRNSDETFDPGDFTQPQDDASEDEWQAAWAEAYLSADGATLSEDLESPPESGDFRVAFFIHEWDASHPLRTSYGDVRCPPPTAMPERLERLVPYQPVD